MSSRASDKDIDYRRMKKDSYYEDSDTESVKSDTSNVTTSSIHSGHSATSGTSMASSQVILRQRQPSNNFRGTTLEWFLWDIPGLKSPRDNPTCRNNSKFEIISEKQTKVHTMPERQPFIFRPRVTFLVRRTQAEFLRLQPLPKVPEFPDHLAQLTIIINDVELMMNRTNLTLQSLPTLLAALTLVDTGNFFKD